MKSPFKFLDAYTFADRNTFFGRDKEIEELYKMAAQTSLLLLYGLSGTGKTSLIQCGLANKFDGPDWFPLFIRRENNINESLQRTLNAAVVEEEEEEVTSLVEQVKSVYRQYLRPVYLIFDQFEELFILGTPTEKSEFVQSIRALMDTRVRCKIILSMREEYLGQLYDFEKIIPTLFDFRLRLDPMTNSKIKEVIQKSFEEFNILLEDPEEERLEQILDNLSVGKSGVSLPYLQVYLDMLYREDFRRIFNRDREGDERPLLTFTQQEIAELGKIENVLEKFLQEQETEIQQELTKKYPNLPAQTVRQVLDMFVTEEGTKRPIRFRQEKDQIILEEKVQELLPEIAPDVLHECLEALERSRLIRLTGENIELAHDTLAALIDGQRSDKDRQLNEIKRRLQSGYEEFQKSGDYLSRRQLTAFEEFIPHIRLDDQVKAYIEASRSYVETQERTEVERQQRELALAQEKFATEQAARRRQRIFLIIVAIVAVIALAFLFFALQQQRRAAQANKDLKEQIFQNTKANVTAFRNDGEYQKAIAQIEEARKLFTKEDQQKWAELDTLQVKILQVAELTVAADSIFNIPDSIEIYKPIRIERLLNSKAKYAQADSLYSDGSIRNKIAEVNRAIDKLFDFYLERADGMLGNGNCRNAIPILCSAQTLKPDQAAILNGFRQCGTEPAECALLPH